MRATRAYISLSTIRRNLQIIAGHLQTTRRASSSSHTPRICLAVKADAYGHGIVEVAGATQDIATHFAVATVDEGVQLRDAGIRSGILLYSLPLPEELEDVVAHRLVPMVGDRDLIVEIAAVARRLRHVVEVHLKVDTGMGRIGCRPEAAADLATLIAETGGVSLAGVCTHFANADRADLSDAHEQLALFREAVATIRGRGVDPGLLHAANSGAVAQLPDAHFDMVRPGILAYGLPPSDAVAPPAGILPAMRFVSRVVFIKRVAGGTPISYGSRWRAPTDRVIGTVPVGYGDGYFRALSNRSTVSIGGNRYPVVGSVCMDQLMVDLGERSSVARYAEAVLFGVPPHEPAAGELAGLANTIPYEITCAVSKRVPRIYDDEQ